MSNCLKSVPRVGNGNEENVEYCVDSKKYLQYDFPFFHDDGMIQLNQGSLISNDNIQLLIFR